MPPEILPSRAVAVINPHQNDCPYPYKELAGCGVAYTLCRAVWKVFRGEPYTEDVELTAGENRILVREGLSRFNSTKIPGLAALLRASGIVLDGAESKPVSTDQVSFGIAPRLNASGRIAHARKGVELLTTESEAEAAGLAEKLCEINTERQAIEKLICQEAMTRLEELRCWSLRSMTA